MIEENRTGGFHREERVYEMGLIPSTRAIMTRMGIVPWKPEPRYDLQLQVVK